MAFASATQGTPSYYFVWDSIPGVSANYTTGQNIDSLTPLPSLSNQYKFNL